MKKNNIKSVAIISLLASGNCLLVIFGILSFVFLIISAIPFTVVYILLRFWGYKKGANIYGTIMVIIYIVVFIFSYLVLSIMH